MFHVKRRLMPFAHSFSSEKYALMLMPLTLVMATKLPSVDGLVSRETGLECKPRVYNSNESLQTSAGG